MNDQQRCANSTAPRAQAPQLPPSTRIRTIPFLFGPSALSRVLAKVNSFMTSLCVHALTCFTRLHFRLRLCPLQDSSTLNTQPVRPQRSKPQSRNTQYIPPPAYDPVDCNYDHHRRSVCVVVFGLARRIRFTLSYQIHAFLSSIRGEPLRLAHDEGAASAQTLSKPLTIG